MIAELGHFTLILAFTVAIFQTLVVTLGAVKNRSDLMALGMPAATVQPFLTAGSFGALITGFATSDFSIALVAAGSNRLTPIYYKIAGLWGSFPGSLLLWVLVLSLFGAILAWFGTRLSRRLHALALALQGIVAVTVLAVILFMSNPFLRLDPPPFDGAGQSLLVQAPGLAILPVFFAFGTAGLGMAFALGTAALVTGGTDASWGRWMRVWSLVGLVFLSVAIVLALQGAVAGAAIVGLWPLTMALACLAVLMKNRPGLARWTILVSILGLAVVLFALLIPRPGPAMGQAVLDGSTQSLVGIAIVTSFMVAALLLFALRARYLDAPGPPGGTSQSPPAAPITD